MPVFTHPEAVYGALCFIYGDDDYMISSNEKYGMKHNFSQYYHLSNDIMESIAHRWAEDTDRLYSDVIESLKASSQAERLEAYRVICITINSFSHERDDRWAPAHRIKHDLDIGDREYDRYVESVEKISV